MDTQALIQPHHDQHLILTNSSEVSFYEVITEASNDILTFDKFYKAFNLFVYEVCDSLLSGTENGKKMDIIKTLSPYPAFPFYLESHLIRLKAYNCVKNDLTGFFALLEQEKDKLHQNDLKGKINNFYSKVMSKEKMDYLNYYLTPLNRAENDLMAKVLMLVENKFKTTSSYGKDARAYFQNFKDYSYMEFVAPFTSSVEILDAGVLIEKCNLQKLAFDRMRENIEKILDDGFILKQITTNN